MERHGISSEALSPHRVLLAEDETRVRYITAAGIRSLGHVVLEAENAASALAMLERDPNVELLITDVRMPGIMDGIALAFEVKRRRPDIGLIIMSGHLDLETTQLPAGALFMRKPCCLSELGAMVSEQLSL